MWCLGDVFYVWFLHMYLVYYRSRYNKIHDDLLSPAAIMVTLQYGVRCPINCFFIDELLWEIPSTSIGR